MVRKCKFTLIELIVCLSTIIFLVSLLIPALNKAIEVTEEIHCANNQEQISLAFGLHMADNNGCIPAAKLPSPEVWPQFMWNSKLIHYLGLGKLGFMNSSDWLEATSAEVLNCPSKPENFVYSYGMNTFNVWSHRSLPIKPHMLSGDLASRMVISDFGHPDFSIPNSDFLYNIPSYVENAFRHDEADSVLFLDGHTDSLEMGVLSYDLILK